MPLANYLNATMNNICNIYTLNSHILLFYSAQILMFMKLCYNSILEEEI